MSNKLKEQTKLKGRGKRIRKGLYPKRGKGRTAHGRRGQERSTNMGKKQPGPAGKNTGSPKPLPPPRPH